MSHLPPLEKLDVDGAIQEAAEKVAPETRASFLRKVGVGVGSVTLGGAFAGGLPAVARGARSQSIPQSDVDILNFALSLEYLESEFYARAVANKMGGVSVLNRFARVAAHHELGHVRFLRQLIGSGAIPKPTFDLKDAVTDRAKFMQAADTLEQTGVHAYLGQVGNLESPTALRGAARILPVEARHAAWIRAIRFPRGRPGTARTPAPAALEDGFTQQQVIAVLNATGFTAGS